MIELIVGFFVLFLFALLGKEQDTEKNEETITPTIGEDSNGEYDLFDDSTGQLLSVTKSSTKPSKKNIVIPSKIFIYSKDDGKEKIRKGLLSIPKNILFFTMAGKTYLPIWKKPQKIAFTPGLKKDGYIEAESKIFIFNALALGVEFDFFIFDPVLNEENELINLQQRIPSNRPDLLITAISFGLDRIFTVEKQIILAKIKKGHTKLLSEILDETSSELYFSALKDKITNLSDSNNVGESESMIKAIDHLANDLEKIGESISDIKGEPETIVNDVIGGNQDPNKLSSFNRESIEFYFESWEKRHDRWVIDFLANAISSEAKSMKKIRSHFQKALLTDWRISLGFLLNRTTYQSRKDIINDRTANYLFMKVRGCKLENIDQELENLINEITLAKRNKQVTHLRENQDIKRLASISSFLKKSQEKNITKIVLKLFNQNEDVISFLKQFDYVGEKTASFYMKFIAWVFDLNFVPIVIDRHVIKSLQYYGYLTTESKNDAKIVIKRLASQLSVSIVKVETALYEKSWLELNKTF